MTDNELKELMFLQSALKSLEERIHELRTMCRRQGSFCTENYVCTITPQTRRGLAGMETVIDALGLELLKEHNLIRVSTFSIVKVAPKGLVLEDVY